MAELQYNPFQTSEDQEKLVNEWEWDVIANEGSFVVVQCPHPIDAHVLATSRYAKMRKPELSKNMPLWRNFLSAVMAPCYHNSIYLGYYIHLSEHGMNCWRSSQKFFRS